MAWRRRGRPPSVGGLQLPQHRYRGVKIRQDQSIVSDPAVADDALAVDHENGAFRDALVAAPDVVLDAVGRRHRAVPVRQQGKAHPQVAGKRLLRKDTGDRNRHHLPAGSLHLCFFVPQLGQSLCSDRAKVEDVEVQQHGAVPQAL